MESSQSGGNIMRKRLVAYFSATGVTETLAKSLADVIHADVHKIISKQPYAREDLDWTNKNSRSTMEMNDKTYRPAVANKVENIERYDVIYIGFPIWWYVAPTIINSFLESYDLTGKTVIPFATSGGSGMGDTNIELIPSCKGAVLKNGKRFSTNVNETELAEWSKAMEL